MIGVVGRRLRAGAGLGAHRLTLRHRVALRALHRDVGEARVGSAFCASAWLLPCTSGIGDVAVGHLERDRRASAATWVPSAGSTATTVPLGFGAVDLLGVDAP